MEKKLNKVLCVCHNYNSKRGNYLDFEASCFFFKQKAEDKESTEAILISFFDPKEMNVCF